MYFGVLLRRPRINLGKSRRFLSPEMRIDAGVNWYRWGIPLLLRGYGRGAKICRDELGFPSGGYNAMRNIYLGCIL
jgi:hypothetical protein